MSNSIPSVVEIFKMLHKSNNKLSATPLSELVSEPGRFHEFSCGMEGILLDYSRIHMDRKTLGLLLELVEASGIEQRRADLFNAEPVNSTENRPAMHMALRSRELGKHLPSEEFDAMENSMDRMLQIADQLHNGMLPAGDNQKIRDIVHIGIGGSLLGTKLLCDVFESQALRMHGSEAPKVHFLGSVDAHAREQLLQSLNPQETVVILVSKSFATADTLMHGTAFQNWLEAGLDRRATRSRMFAVTGAKDRAIAYGIAERQLLYLPPWVGGRYSLWSPVSLSAAAIGGSQAFRELIRGAAEMDRHFLTAKPEKNMPVLMGMIGVWHRNICGYSSWGVIPYDQRLRALPAHLQQLIMESNGKSVTADGAPVSLATAPVVFGECGTDAQHSLFQALHQGTEKVPLNLIAVIRPDHEDKNAHHELLANFLAQASALAMGRSAEQTRLTLKAKDEFAGEGILVHRTFEGNRPSELLVLDDLSPGNLGKLLALYEHKVFVESVIWEINAFDQWGVELGKSLSPEIRRALTGNGSVPADIESLTAFIRERF